MYPEQSTTVRVVVRQTFIEIRSSVLDRERASMVLRKRAFSDFEVCYSGNYGKVMCSAERSSASEISTVLGSEDVVSYFSSSSRESPIRQTSALSTPVSAGEVAWTTLVLRGLPQGFSRTMACALLESAGFSCRYDFVHVPVDFCSWSPFGHAFVNLVSQHDALALMRHFELVDSTASGITVAWSAPIQGLEQLLEHYRNSPVMNYAVREIYKPLLLVNGTQTAFPRPTKRVRFPRGRKTSQYSKLRAKIEDVHL